MLLTKTEQNRLTARHRQVVRQTDRRMDDRLTVLAAHSVATRWNDGSGRWEGLDVVVAADGTDISNWVSVGVESMSTGQLFAWLGY